MAIWADEITLIAQAEPEERLNSNGFPNDLTETPITVFCNKKSVGYSEFFKSQQAGIQVDFKVDVHTADYDGQQLAEFEGKRYQILKTYGIDDDTVELTLSDLRQQSHNTAESEG